LEFSKFSKLLSSFFVRETHWCVSLTKKLSISSKNLENSNLFTSPCWILRIYSICYFAFHALAIASGRFSGNKALRWISSYFKGDPTQRNISEILLNQPEIRWYLPFSNWFGSKRTSVWIQINRKMVNTIWFRVDLTRFRKYFSGCRLHVWSLLFFQSSSTIEKYVLLRKSHSLTIAPWKILVIDGKFRA